MKENPSVMGVACRPARNMYDETEIDTGGKGMKKTEEKRRAMELVIRAGTGRPPQDATPWEFWLAVSRVVVAKLADNWQRTRTVYRRGRMQHYFSAEFLVGRSLLNNLVNLELYDTAREGMAIYGKDLAEILELEDDPGLGNGGLGRLAACFLDSCATHDLPVQGYGILYRYGLFRQYFENGFQRESPDIWKEEGYPFLVQRDEERVAVHFDDLEVAAVPYDLPITGYGTKNVNTLRLWQDEYAEEINLELFNKQQFDAAMAERNKAEDISRVLYPNDTTYNGKVLRVRQQYFFSSASLQDMIRTYKAIHGEDLGRFAEFNTVQLNDTHPVLAIPELMRLLMDENGMGWDEAWRVTCDCFAYTNHTTLEEALERWDVSIFRLLFPRILQIVEEIDRRFREDMRERGFFNDRIEAMAPLSGHEVRMAWIACYASFSINGVASLHTEILKADTLRNWYEIWPEKFNNKTNGVTPRRWLHHCNPKLSALLTEMLGDDGWARDLDRLKELEPFGGDPAVLRRLMAVKRENKEALAEYILQTEGIRVRSDAVFDVQIKRLHEYKRQLMNALYILDLYFRIKDDPNGDFVPRVMIFGAKSAPGYARAKAVIKLINEIARVVNGDPEVGDRLKVVFIQNYNVSKAERLIPAADVSEQISTAGKEASGTGNMKFMMNGALTLGTYDGANVEIVRAVGEKNAYIFGVRYEAMAEAKEHYDPYELYERVPGLRRVLDALTDGTLSDGNTGKFADLSASLLTGTNWEPADVYHVLGDFEDYRATRDRMARDFLVEEAWAAKCWVNITNSGLFSSDRTVAQYAEEVWRIGPVPVADAMEDSF